MMGGPKGAPAAASPRTVPQQPAIQSGWFFETVDRLFLPRIRARVDKEPLFLIEELVKARTFALFNVVLVGFNIFAFTLLYLQQGSVPFPGLGVFWICVALFFVPYTLRRAESPWVHTTVGAVLINAFPWVVIAEGAGYRSQGIGGMIITPVATMLLMGARPGIASAINCYAMVLAKFALEHTGYEFPYPVDDAMLRLVILSMGAINAAAVVVLCLSFEWVGNIRLRALETMNSSLQTAIQETVAMSEIKERFLANMSHEIRTPLNGIIGMTEYLLQTQLTWVQQKELGIIRQCGVALLSIITDILDFSKIVANKVELERVVFSIDEVVVRCFDTLALKIADKKIQAVHELSALRSSRCMGDPTRLQQILLNLLSNAVKFTPVHGEIVLRMWSDRASEGMTRLHCEVEDTGPGVQPAYAQHIFDAFSQADANITRIHGGTGLGLAITHSLVHLMGGSIAVRPRFSGGSVFAFDVAVDDAPPVAGSPTRIRRNRPALNKAPGGRVLLVDDCESHALAVRTMLRATGHEVAPVETNNLARMLALGEGESLVVNMHTYLPDADVEKEHHVLELLKSVLARPPRDTTTSTSPPPRLVLLVNPLGVELPLLDAFMTLPGVANRMRAVHVDRAAVTIDLDNSADRTAYAVNAAALAPHLVSPSARARERVGAGVGSTAASGATLNASLSGTSSTTELPTRVSLDNSTNASECAVEIVFICKPAVMRQLHWALTEPLGNISNLEPGLVVVERTRLVPSPEKQSSRPLPAEVAAGEDRVDVVDEARVAPAQGSPGGVSVFSLDETAGSGTRSALGMTVVEDGHAVGPSSATGAAYSAPTTARTVDERRLRRASSVSEPILAPPASLRLDPDASLEASADSLKLTDPGTPSPTRAPLPLRLLLVEDNTLNVAVARRLLKLLGHVPEVAENGRDAIAWYEAYAERCRSTTRGGGSEEALVVLMDLHLPLVSGMDATRAILDMAARDGGGAASLPYVVAVTADALESTRSACLSSGFADFLSKPFLLNRLKEVLQRATDAIEARR